MPTRPRSLAAALVAAIVLLVISAALPASARWLPGAPDQEADSADPLLPPEGHELQAGLVASPGGEQEPALQAFAQVLAEEGFPHAVVPTARLAGDPAALRRRYAALILPDAAARQLPPAAVAGLEAYVRDQGGQVLAVYDAGTVAPDGRPLAPGALAGLTGVELRPLAPGALAGLTGVELRPPAPGALAGLTGVAGPPPAAGPERAPWVIPPASPLRRAFDPALFTADHRLRPPHGPELESLRLPVLRVAATPLAYAHPWRRLPEDAAVTRRAYPGGGVAYHVNAPLGLHKYRANDDFILRDLLRFFLIGSVRLPRLVPAPDGVGGLVINMHLCSGIYFKDLDKIRREGLLTRAFPFSIHVTAGPDDDQPGDGKGVGADTPKGAAYLRMLQEYGTIGSQGGWFHNYWARHARQFSELEVRRYLELNLQALERVTGQKVREYSAAGGTHTPLMNDVLAGHGIRAVAAPLGWNSPPTHAWFDGRREDRFWVFPYTGTQYGSCFYNMYAAGRAPAEIAGDLHRIIERVERSRQIRHVYFHPGEITREPQMWLAIQERILQGLQAGRLTVQTMSSYADFLDRHRQVTLRVAAVPQGWHVALRAPAPGGLQGMTVALPVGRRAPGAPPFGARVRTERGWAYLTVTEAAAQLQGVIALR